jgi:Mn2+/Fe2+ NRAMP family transporter
MKWLFIGLFIFGCFSLMATYGASNLKQKKIYKWITIVTWIVTFVLANLLLNNKIGK